MKTLALVVTLSTLVSCVDGDGKGGGSNGGPVKERYQNALSTLQRGQSADSKSQGQTRSYDWNTDTVSSAPVDKEEFSVVLKIEGTKVYTYNVETDKVDGTVEKSVELESHDASDMDEILKLPGTIMMGDVLMFSTTFESDWTLSTASVRESHALRASVNLGKPLCEMNMSLTSSGTMTTAAGSIPLPVISNNTVQTCGRILSSAELTAIDLSSIEFCDQTVADDEVSCESDRDMSFLTSDL